MNDNPASVELEGWLKTSFGERVRYLPGRGRGAGPARNLGVEEARGDYIAFLDDDDLWSPRKLALQTELLGRGPARALCYTKARVRHPGWEEVRPKRLLFQDEPVASFLFHEGGLIHPSSWMLPTSLAKEFPFPSGLHEDWLVLLELDRSGCRFLGVDEDCTVWNQDRPDSWRATCLPSATRLYRAASHETRPTVRLDYIVSARLERGQRWRSAFDLLRACWESKWTVKKWVQHVATLFRNRTGRLSSEPLRRMVVIGNDDSLNSSLSSPTFAEVEIRRFSAPESIRDLARLLLRESRKILEFRPQVVVSCESFGHLLNTLLGRFLRRGSWRRVFWQNSLRADPRFEGLLSAGISYDDIWVLPDAASATQFCGHWLLPPALVCEKARWEEKLGKLLGRARLNLLCLVRDFPYPLDTGARIRTANLLEQLRLDFNVTVLSLETPDSERLGHSQAFCHRLVLPCPEWRKPAWWSRLLPREVSLFTRWSADESVWREVVTRQYDVLVYDHLHSTFHGWDIGCVPRVVLTHNVESVLLRRWLARPQPLEKRLRACLDYFKMRLYEPIALNRAKRIAAVSETDRAELQRMTGRPVSVVETGVDETAFPFRSGEGALPTICFVGTLQWFPNEDAIRYFLSEVWPLIVSELPTVRCLLVGGHPGEELRSLVARFEGVRLTGYVEDVRPYLAEAWVCIVPLRMGSGTRIKILEALATGVPVVSSRLGAEGLPLVNGKHIRLADNAQDFAHEVLMLLMNEQLRVTQGEVGRELVEERLTWARQRPVLKNLLSSLYSNPDNGFTSR